MSKQLFNCLDRYHSYPFSFYYIFNTPSACGGVIDSLLEPKINKQLYNHPVFATKPFHCWSIDESDLPSFSALDQVRKLTLDYKKGTVFDAFTGNQIGGASVTNFSSFIRAVRSIK